MRWAYRIDGILGRHVDDASLAKYSTNDLGYADDSAFLAASCEQLARYALQFQQQYTGWGLNLSVAKTEAMATTGAHGHDRITVSPDSEGHKCIKYTDVFKYLGSQIHATGGCEHEITHRIDAARKAFWRLTSSVWDVKQISLGSKLRVYRACVISILLYGAETWTTTFSCRYKLEKFSHAVLKKDF